MATVETAELVRRIWARDASVWTGADEDRWLGWLDEPGRMLERIPELESFADSVRGDGFTDVVLAGMGGSSLAPEVLRRAARSETFHVLDTTHPDAIRALEARLDLERTLFLVASKSGTTLETQCHLAYFWERTGRRGDAFAAITDPGSELETQARERGFRAVFAGEPSIGGRYSALSVFGMVPAALMGWDLDALLSSAAETAAACREQEDNPGLEFGLRLGHGWRDGRDKVCIGEQVTVPDASLWAEQLLAESTGKDGKGLVPVPNKWARTNFLPPGGPDRQEAYISAEFPHLLGGELYCWEFATAVAGAVMELNPFDQPNVQEAKDRTAEILAGGEESTLEPVGSLDDLIGQAEPGDYFCLQAFVEPTADAEERLKAVCERVGSETGIVATAGFGPRYLHSTGQLHKGGPPTGLFLQVVDEPEELAIPGKPFGFRQLIGAQAAGDFDALRERGRRVARARWEEIA